MILLYIVWCGTFAFVAFVVSYTLVSGIRKLVEMIRRKRAHE